MADFDDQEGGNKNDVDLTSISLKGSDNWFTERLRKRQPDIFVTSSEEEKRIITKTMLVLVNGNIENIQ